MQKNILSTYFYSIVFFFLVVFIIVYPNEAFSSALSGLNLWFNVVCPALLPFFICIEILIGLGVVSFLGELFRDFMRPVFNMPGESSFAFFMSMSSGYPIGAKIVSNLRQNGNCTKEEGQRMLTLCSTSGPLFIVGAVATGILNNPSFGFLLAISHYFSAITLGYFMRFYKIKSKPSNTLSNINPFKAMIEHRSKDNRGIGIMLGDAVRNGVNLVLVIGGFVILFSVITNILKVSGILNFLSYFISLCIPFFNISQETISCVLIGILELTNGINSCASLSVPLISKIVIVSFMLSFGGLSVNAQVMSIVSNTDLKFNLYLLLKFLQGIIASIFSYIFFILFTNMQILDVFITSKPNLDFAYNNYSWIGTFINSSKNLFYILIFILILGLISWNPLAKNKTI